MRYWHIALVAIGTAVLTFICMILAPHVTVWPLIVLDSPAVLVSMSLTNKYYFVVAPAAAAVQFSVYTLVFLITRGRARLVAMLLIAVFHTACAVAATLLLPNPPH